MDSSSDDILQQKKGDDEVVKWNEFGALRESLTNNIDKVNTEVKGKFKTLEEHLTTEFQGVDTSITSLVKISEAHTNQFNTITQQLEALTKLMNSRLPNPEDNASASVQNDGHATHEDANYFPAGHGRGIAQHHGRGGHIPQARRVPFDNGPDRKSTRLNSSHITRSRMPSSA